VLDAGQPVHRVLFPARWRGLAWRAPEQRGIPFDGGPPSVEK
jgi:hypothetical protein